MSVQDRFALVILSLLVGICILRRYNYAASLETSKITSFDDIIEHRRGSLSVSPSNASLPSVATTSGTQTLRHQTSFIVAKPSLSMWSPSISGRPLILQPRLESTGISVPHNLVPKPSLVSVVNRNVANDSPSSSPDESSWRIVKYPAGGGVEGGGAVDIRRWFTSKSAGSRSSEEFDDEGGSEWDGTETEVGSVASSSCGASGLVGVVWMK
ncbi:hypothetical protein BCR33DRAFT_713031 [Rhizoclosmatium globosum]|uniref:Uncharacterized protein n=1 Tax=Rhizoclosmatium globosum TaxID=329046 RepID=A0A1Y2CVR5_9FUNG|nr:hypothetical protein BCR33DRAFT_713031 [Rhizoclosmatium globosum]|eukprot:ORY51118.1 hypothetical protein BCR33DRAFT_713031 [Rhizoclosmatium globosum]